MEFKQVLKEKRKALNLTQSDLALILNVSDKTISSWENGRSYPDILMLKSIAKALNTDVNVLIDATDLKEDINNIDKEEALNNKKKEKKYIRNIIISISLNFFLLLIPITHIVLSKVYNLHISGNINNTSNFTEYEKVSKIVFPILILLSFIMLISSISIFIYSTIRYKKDLLYNNYNVRYKLIMYKYINAYLGTLITILFLAFTPIYMNLISLISMYIILLVVYLIIHFILNKQLNLIQIYNVISIVLILLIGVSTILILIFTIINNPIILLFPLILTYIFTIILLAQKDVKKYVE